MVIRPCIPEPGHEDGPAKPRRKFFKSDFIHLLVLPFGAVSGPGFKESDPTPNLIALPFVDVLFIRSFRH